MRIIQVYSSKVNSKQTRDYAPFLTSQLEGMRQHIDYIEINLNKGRNALKILKNIYLLRRKTFKNSIIHVHYGAYLAAFTFLFSKSQIKIVSFGGTDLNGKLDTSYRSLLYNLPLKIINRYVQYRADWIIVKSNGLKEKINSTFYTKTSVIPNGVDLAFFDPDKSKQPLSLELENSFNILFNFRRGGQVDHIKNMPLAVKAVKELEKRGRSVRLVLIENIPRQEMPTLLCKGNCLLLTSFSEGSPNIVKEAMACNLPIVSVDCGDVSWLLQGVNNSFISPRYDPNHLADLLEQVIDSNDKSNGREILMKKSLDSESRILEILEIYNKFQL